MTKRTVGFVELEWNCPNCGSKNPGMQKTCGTCGAPQPENIQFELGQQRDVISDPAKELAAAKGADIHCPYCGTRNAANAPLCSQCGGDLQGGVKRESGRVLSAGPVQAGEIPCPSCGTMNPAGSGKCTSCGALLSPSKPQAANPAAQTATQAAAGQKAGNFRPWMALPLVAILLLVCVTIGYFLFRTESMTGVVQGVGWQRVIYVEDLRDVTREAWRDQVPRDGDILSCKQEFRARQDSPAPNAKEVCATAYVDKGNGVAEVVETCYYEVYDDFCKYSAREWQQVDESVARGADLSPYWPQVSLTGSQREGRRTESYSVYFETTAGVKEYSTDNAALFTQLRPGSEWMLSINSFGQVVEISP